MRNLDKVFADTIAEAMTIVVNSVDDRRQKRYLSFMQEAPLMLEWLDKGEDVKGGIRKRLAWKKMFLQCVDTSIEIIKNNTNRKEINK